MARTLLSILLGVQMLGILPGQAQAQDDVPTLLLFRPHCEEADLMRCPDFEVADPVMVQTPPLQQGDTLAIDLVIRSPAQRPISRIRAWISYDPTMLLGTNMEIDDRFPVPTPGENMFDTEAGYAKIGASAREGSASTDELFVAVRLQFKVLPKEGATQTVLSFYDLLPSAEGHTAVISENAQGEEENVLPSLLGSLLVLIEDRDAQASSVSVVESAAPPETSDSPPAPPPARTSFTQLQVQNLRITTEGTSILLAWNPLRSADVEGYNVYYGTEMGRYIQRKSISGDQQSLIIRGLPLKATYFVSIRAVSETGEESAFSREVSVEVGDPKSSTAPLRGAIGPAGRNPLAGGSTPSVPGESGTAADIALLLLVSSLLGTVVAFRRQLLTFNR